jgi:hypothetical protein
MLARCGLREHEEAAHVQVHHFVPGLELVVLGRRAPGGAGVVDEDVDAAEALHRGGDHALAFFGQRGIGGDPAGIDAARVKMSRGLREVIGLARAQHDAGAGLAEAFGDLQAEAARAASDEGRLAFQVEEFVDVRSRRGRRRGRVHSHSGFSSWSSGSRRAATASQASILGSS